MHAGCACALLSACVAVSHRSADGSRVQIRFEDGSVNTDNAGDGDLALSKGIKVRPLEELNHCVLVEHAGRYIDLPMLVV